MSGWIHCAHCETGYDERKEDHECIGLLRARVAELKASLAEADDIINEHVATLEREKATASVSETGKTSSSAATFDLESQAEDRAEDRQRPSEAVPSKASLDVARSFIAGLMLAGTQFESSTIKIAANLARVIDGAVNAARPETARQDAYPVAARAFRAGYLRGWDDGDDAGKDYDEEAALAAWRATQTGGEDR